MKKNNLIFVGICLLIFIAIAMIPTRSISKTAVTSIPKAHTKVFAGQTPGEALADWKEAFPERTVVEWKIRVDGNELEISYTK